jgi:hypothetical protein
VRSGEEVASLELIEYVPHQHNVADDGKVTWAPDSACRPIRNLPQLLDRKSVV